MQWSKEDMKLWLSHYIEYQNSVIDYLNIAMGYNLNQIITVNNVNIAIGNIAIGIGSSSSTPPDVGSVVNSAASSGLNQAQVSVDSLRAQYEAQQSFENYNYSADSMQASPDNYHRLGFDLQQKINLGDIWMPSFDMLDINTVRLGLLDETVMYEAIAFYYLFFGPNGKMRTFYT